MQTNKSIGFTRVYKRRRTRRLVCCCILTFRSFCAMQYTFKNLYYSENEKKKKKKRKQKKKKQEERKYAISKPDLNNIFPSGLSSEIVICINVQQQLCVINFSLILSPSKFSFKVPQRPRVHACVPNFLDRYIEGIRWRKS